MTETDTHKTKGLLPLAPLGGFENIMLNLVTLFSLPVQVLFRKNLGKRHLRVFHTSFLSFTIYVLWLGTLTLAPWMLGSKELILSWFFLLIVSLMASIHAVDIYLRPKRGVKLHSYYSGWPRLMDVMPHSVKRKFVEWEINLEIFTKMYLEPGLCFLLFWLIFPVDRMLAILLGIGGASLYIYGQYKASRDEDKLLDVIDGQIEAEMLHKDLSVSTNGLENLGYESYASTPKAKVLSTKAKPTNARPDNDNAPSLTPELDALLNEPEEEDEPATTSTTASVRIGDSPSRKESNVDVTPITRPRGRPRKDSAVYP